MVSDWNLPICHGRMCLYWVSSFSCKILSLGIFTTFLSRSCTDISELSLLELLECVDSYFSHNWESFQSLFLQKFFFSHPPPPTPASLFLLILTWYMFLSLGVPHRTLQLFICLFSFRFCFSVWFNCPDLPGCFRCSAIPLSPSVELRFQPQGFSHAVSIWFLFITFLSLLRFPVRLHSILISFHSVHCFFFNCFFIFFYFILALSVKHLNSCLWLVIPCLGFLHFCQICLYCEWAIFS